MKKTMFHYYCKTMLAGFAQTLAGTATAVLGAMAALCFKATTQESGYSAVCSFIAAIVFTVLALVMMYTQGAGKLRSEKKKGRFVA